jgi:hypothetical protein
MFKRILLALVCVAAFGAASVVTPDSADAGWRYRGRPGVSVYYGPRYDYYRPSRSYYRTYYRPRYYDYDSYYYGGPRYYSYPDEYYGGGSYYGGRGGVSVSFGF